MLVKELSKELFSKIKISDDCIAIAPILQNTLGHQTMFQITEMGSVNYADPNLFWWLDGAEKIRAELEAVPPMHVYDRYRILNNALKSKKIVVSTDVILLLEHLPDFHEEISTSDIGRWNEYKKYLVENKESIELMKKNIIKNQGSLRLGILGELYPGLDLPIIASELEALGVDVVRISTDKYDVAVPYHIDDFLEQSDIAQFRSQNKVLRIMPKIKELHLDAILAKQYNLPIDWRGDRPMPPFFYMASQTVTKNWPMNADVTAFIHNYFGAVQSFENCHTYEMKKVPETRRLFLPHGWSPDQYFVKKEEIPSFFRREIFFGFMGNAGTVGSDSENVDPIQEHIYTKRAETVEYCKKECGLVCEDPKGYATLKEYSRFMQNVKFALNVGTFGGVNQRQYHAMGLGCVLVQKYYPELSQLGYIDKVNCLLFKNKEEIPALLSWAAEHLTECGEIQLAGIELAYKNTYKERAAILNNFIRSVLGGK